MACRVQCVTLLTTDDTDCIALSGNGTPISPLVATLTIDPDPDNPLSCGASGLTFDTSRIVTEINARARLGVDVAATGDSNTIGYAPVTPLPADFRPVEQSWFYHACYGSRGLLRFVTNTAVGGYTSTQIIARANTAIAANPDVLFIMAGTNDWPAGIPLATTATNIQTMVSACIDAGVLPVLMTIPPRIAPADYTEQIADLNGWLRDFCRRNRIDLIDVHSLVVDPDTDTFRGATGYGDDVHLSVEGAQEVGREIVRWAESRFPWWRPNVSTHQGLQGEANNLIGGGNFTGISGGGVPNQWSILFGSEFSGPTTLSLQAPVASDHYPARMVGNWYQIDKVLSAASTAMFQQVLPAVGWSAGDEIEFTGRVQSTGITGGVGYAEVYVVCINGGGALLAPVYESAGEGDWLFNIRRTIPAGTTRLDVYLRFRRVSGSITGTVRFGEFALRNLTTLNWSSYG